MSALVKIDQAGLPAGVAGKSRTDGLSTGALVTLTNVGTGSTTRFRLLWVPAGDTTAVSSLVQTGPKVWTFSPSVSKPGTYRIELIQNEGQASEKRERRTLKMRTPIFGLTIPALNEIGDPSASLQLAGTAQIEAAEDNADDYPIAAIAALRFGAWWRWVHEITLALESTFRSATGSANGYASFTKLNFANNGLQWTTVNQVPAGNELGFRLRGPGGGGCGGMASCTVGATTTLSNAAAGGQGAEHTARFSRALLVAFIANGPITFNLPDGGLGGALVSRASSVGQTLGNGGNPSAADASITAVDAAGNTIVLMFAGRGGGGPTHATVGDQCAAGAGGGALGAGAGGPANAATTAGGEPHFGGNANTAWGLGLGGAGSTGAENPGNGADQGGAAGAPGNQASANARAGGRSGNGGGGGGGGGGTSATTVRNGGDGGGSKNPLAVSGKGGVGTVGGTGVLAAAEDGRAGDESHAGWGGGGGGAARGTGANQTGSQGGAGGEGGGGGGGGGTGSADDTHTAVGAAGGKGGSAQLIIIGYPG